MLNLIVLGQVPGTHIELTFLQILLLSASFVFIAGLIYELNLRRKIFTHLLIIGVVRVAK